MSETETFVVGHELPRIASVTAGEGFQVTVTWDRGERAGQTDTVDLGPELFKFRLYAPLRNDPALFRTAHVANWGSTIAWDGIEADMSAAKVLDLAAEVMTPDRFAEFVKRRGYTLDGIAAELGISRRQAAYFQNEKAVPRYIALACAYLEEKDDGTRRVLKAQSDILREAANSRTQQRRPR